MANVFFHLSSIISFNSLSTPAIFCPTAAKVKRSATTFQPFISTERFWTNHVTFGSSETIITWPGRRSDSTKILSSVVGSDCVVVSNSQNVNNRCLGQLYCRSSVSGCHLSCKKTTRSHLDDKLSWVSVLRMDPSLYGERWCCSFCQWGMVLMSALCCKRPVAAAISIVFSDQ